MHIPKVWITKYALTSGIFTRENVKQNVDTPNMISYTNEHGIVEHYFGNEWHRTEDEANAHIHKLLCAKIRSTKKQLVKLEAMLVQYAVRKSK